jgi:hypothetical protein
MENRSKTKSGIQIKKNKFLPYTCSMVLNGLYLPNISKRGTDGDIQVIKLNQEPVLQLHKENT